jgi:hypothetical protein
MARCAVLEKDQAKALGARWDLQSRRWYATGATMTALQRWAALPDIPTILPGENRTFGGGLFVDLVPKSRWFTNVRSCVDQQDWERLRRMVVDRPARRCEVCGDRQVTAERHWLEVHERWAYEENKDVQALRRLLCLCINCHSATHPGLTGLRGTAEDAKAHLARVNQWTAHQLEEHIAAAFRWFAQRSRRQWKLDLAILESTEVVVTPPPAPQQRIAIASESPANSRNGR